MGKIKKQWLRECQSVFNIADRAIEELFTLEIISPTTRNKVKRLIQEDIDNNFKA